MSAARGENMKKVFVAIIGFMSITPSFAVGNTNCTFELSDQSDKLHRSFVIRQMSEKGYTLATDSQSPRLRVGFKSSLDDMVSGRGITQNAWVMIFDNKDSNYLAQYNGAADFYFGDVFNGRNRVHRLAVKRALEQVPACTDQ
jgi:hypothetical protein